MPRVSIRKLVLLALNLVSTFLTLLTGLRENPLIVLITGRYDLIRSRLLEGTINYNIIRDDLFLKDHLPDLLHVGESYRFISAPRRGPDNLGVDRSLCMRVNSYNATVMNLNFDDFWGYGPRRNQMYHFSISAPHCDVVNILPSWYNATCIYAIGGGNESICGQYIFDHFETLADNRVILALSESDTGALGIPFLRCRGRSEKAFGYMTDLMCDQSYWAGGSYHVEIQSSRCLANPVVRSPDWKYTLFKVASADQTAEVVMGIDNTGWFVTIVSILYGIVTIWMIVHGILAAILQSRHAEYVPQGVRFLHEWRIFKVILPFMPIATHAPHGENRVISFKGVTFMASDVWMNHWLYISLSMLEAVSTIRTTYIIFQMGTWMLGMKITTQNFIFTCGAVTKITWIICLVHSILRWMCKLGLNSIKKLKLIRSRTREQLEWYVDAIAMLTSYKIYSLLLCLVLYIMLKVRKTTTLMVRQVPYKHAVWGGDANLARFWGSEIVCDLIVTVSLVLGSGIVLSSFTLLTKYRHITRNSFLRVLQTRFFVVGWDVYVALEALGMDPFDPTLVEDGICKTSCSIGAVLQQFYTSGMSGHVNLAGDHIFTENGFSKEVPKLRYSIKKATAMGLCDFKRSRSGASTTSVSNTYKVDDRGSHNEPGASQLVPQSGTEDQDAQKTMSFIKTKSLFDRKLKIVTEGYFGKILIIDEEDAGRAVKAKTSTAMEFEVNELLSVLSIMDIKPLLGNDKKLHIR